MDKSIVSPFFDSRCINNLLKANFTRVMHTVYCYRYVCKCCC